MIDELVSIVITGSHAFQLSFALLHPLPEHIHARKEAEPEMPSRSSPYLRPFSFLI